MRAFLMRPVNSRFLNLAAIVSACLRRVVARITGCKSIPTRVSTPTSPSTSSLWAGYARFRFQAFAQHVNPRFFFFHCSCAGVDASDPVAPFLLFAMEGRWIGDLESAPAGLLLHTRILQAHPRHAAHDEVCWSFLYLIRCDLVLLVFSFFFYFSDHHRSLLGR